MKLCWWCKWFRYWQAERGYSEMTPGTDFAMACGKRHWEFNAYKTTEAQFAKNLSRAETCRDFVSALRREEKR